MRAIRFFLPGLLCLSLLAPTAAPAADYRYPRALPALVLTLPDAWQVPAQETGTERLAVWSSPQDENYLVTLMSLPADTTPASRDAILAAAARTAAAAAGLTDIRVSAVTEERINEGLRTFAMVHASGKHNGADVIYVYAAFKLDENGRYYVLGEAGPDASLLAHKEEFQKVANSIQPVGAGTP